MELSRTLWKWYYRNVGLTTFRNFVIISFVYASQGREKTWPDRDSNSGPLAYQALCKLGYRATWSTFDISPYLIKFVPESARNNGRTQDMHLLMVVVLAVNPYIDPPNVTGEKVTTAKPGFEPRASRLPCEHSAN